MAWINHGTAGTGVAQGVGAVNLGGGVPVAYIVGTDGNLWMRDHGWTTGGWNWYFHGVPPGVTISFPVGATVLRRSPSLGQSGNAFIVGNDGNLWVRGWDGGFLWDNVGKPSSVALSKTVGVTAVGTPNANTPWYPYVYLIGSDGNLWSAWFDGAWNWTNHGMPGAGIADAVGVTTVGSGTRPFVFVTGNDGNLWSRNWNGSSWAWYNHGTPSGLSIAASLGVTYANSNSQPFAFIKASDGNLWSQHWNGSSWVWTNHGTPAGVGIGASMGATAINNNNPYVYFTGTDGNLWLRWWSGSAWGWYNNGQP